MKKPNLAAMTPEVAKAIEEMMAEQGEMFSLEKVNLAELTRRTGLSRQKLRRMKAHNFEDTQHATKGRKSPVTLLSGLHGSLGRAAEKRRDQFCRVFKQVERKRLYWQPDHD